VKDEFSALATVRIIISHVHSDPVQTAQSWIVAVARYSANISSSRSLNLAAASTANHLSFIHAARFERAKIPDLKVGYLAPSQNLPFRADLRWHLPTPGALGLSDRRPAWSFSK
jgi:hypothetical protein